MNTKYRPLLSAFAVVAAVVASVASTGDKTAEKVEETTAESPVEPGATASSEAVGQSSSTDNMGNEPADQFVVGDLVAIGDWQIKVHEVIDPLESTNEFVVPADGFRWVAVDAEVTNIGDQAASVSSLLCFEVMDAENRFYTVTVTGESLGSLDGDVAADGSRRGTVVFEVPADATGLQLNFSCDVLSSESATIQL